VTGADIEKRLNDIEKKLNLTIDLEEIRKLHYLYVNCVARADWDEILNYFSKDAVLDVIPDNDAVKGKAEIEKVFRGTLSEGHKGKEGLVAVHPVINIDGDKADGSWTLFMMFAHPRTGQSLFWVQGFYEMEYIRENGKWKISYLRFRHRLGPPGSKGDPPPWVNQ
jgi:hypothetical protein